MKASIDKDLCTDCGICVDTCPDVFETVDNVVTVKVGQVPDKAVECAKASVEACPTEAIKLEG